MKSLLVLKLESHNGLSRMVIIVGLVALVLLLTVFIQFFSSKVGNGMNDLDQKQVTFAVRKATLEYEVNRRAFTSVFDTENKTFVDQRTARSSVTPYGTSKENQGKYILVTVDDDGNITTEWISPY